MLSALSVLALLLAADKTPAPKTPAPVKVPALAVDVDFVCRSRATQSLVLTPKAQGQLPVPEDCPEAGAQWRLTLECAQDTCTGLVRASQGGALARIEGTRKELRLKPFADEHPRTLDFMALTLSGQYTVELKSAEAQHQRPVQLLVQHPMVTGVYTLSPSERLPVVFELQGKRLVLHAQATWSDEEHVHLTLNDSRDALLFDKTLGLDEPQALDCGGLRGFCQGALKLSLRENQALPYH